MNGCPTRVQLINRKNSQQWYINFPASIAQAMQFVKGEICEWIIKNRQVLILRRRQVPATGIDSKKRPPVDRSLRPGAGGRRAGV